MRFVSLLLNGLFQVATRRKLRNLAGRDFDGSAGLGIPSSAGFPLRDGKSAETDDGDFLPLFQGRGDSADQRIEGGFSLRLGSFGILRNFSYKITFIQSIVLLIWIIVVGSQTGLSDSTATEPSQAKSAPVVDFSLFEKPSCSLEINFL